MSTDADVSKLEVRGRILLLTIDSPPVNALGQPVRAALLDAVERLRADAAVDALVIACAGRTFFAGADIREFGKPPVAPHLPDVINAIEASAKPVIPAIHGTALGGGLEVALGCHLRIAVPSAKLGLPEVKLGLLPGAGGTQRLPRLVGVKKALAMMTGGDPIGAAEAKALGLIDRVAAEGALIDAAINLATEAITGTAVPRKTRHIAPDKVEQTFFQTFRSENARKFGRFEAPLAIVEVVETGLGLPFDQAVAAERRRFEALRDGAQSKALRYVFFAEREIATVPGIDAKTPTLPIATVGVIGAGTMGSGIAINFLLAGMRIILVEQNEAALTRGAESIRKAITRNVESRRSTQAAADKALSLLTPSLKLEDVGTCDLIIEAAFETMEIKKEIFSRLDRIARTEAILATNTSYLNVDEIAGVTSRPANVLGMHFFSPANVMKLLEVVRAKRTSPTVLATVLKLAKTIGKIPVVSGVCYGFIGNRMLAARRTHTDRVILEGASPADVDRVAEDFGFAMGPFRVADLAGLDLGWSKETSTGATVKERLCDLGRRGQKTGAGYYDYDDKMRPSPSPVANKVIRDFAAEKSIPQQTFSDAEILSRLIEPMIAEGHKILAEGIALRASDIDVVWLHGYGWPRWRGGPMYYAGHRA